MGTTPIYSLRYPDGTHPSTTWYQPWQDLAEDVEDELERLDKVFSGEDDDDNSIIIPTGGTTTSLGTNVEIEVGPRGIAIVNFRINILGSDATTDTRVWRVWTILTGANSVDEHDEQWRARSGMFGGSSFYGSSPAKDTRIFRGLNAGTTTVTMWASSSTDTFTVGSRVLSVATF